MEPVTHPPIEVETRPPPEVDEDKLNRYRPVSSAVLGSESSVPLESSPEVSTSRNKEERLKKSLKRYFTNLGLNEPKRLCINLHPFF